MANLFNKNILKDKLEKFEIESMEEKIGIVKQRYDSYKQGNLQKMTEKEVEQSYNEEILGKVLGYTNFPANPYTRQPQPKTEVTGQKPDFGLGFYYQGDEKKDKTLAVIEVKDAKTDINKSQRREGNLSPIQQGFKYKPQYSDCRWVIVSNFYETKLFVDTQIDYEVWTLDNLVNPEDNYFQFRKFYFLLCAENFISESGKSKTEELLSAVRIQEEKITKEFYKEYKQLRLELIRDLQKRNPSFSITTLVTKAQKIIDRLVFVHFCEDLGLLPQGKLKENVLRAGEIEVSPWHIVKIYFKGVDSGSEKLGIPDGYNGGLFAEDPTLNSLTVGDDVCKKFVDLGDYDFSEDVGVNILGHIFEQSISDLEDLKADLLEEKGSSKADEAKVNKRKKDGIFYTPEYIVDYIVSNSLGKYLEEKFEGLAKQHKKEFDLYQAYQKILQSVKVLDPACGSGAFLVKVFDFLLEENVRVMKILAGGDTGLLDTSAMSKDILQNNIYGVDLNDESVEISKLSLWLKTAQKGKKLASLDNNIKCGNSLIDDPEVAGEKAFDWNVEFKTIMDNGGFDVVVGNPPYVSLERMKDTSEYFSTLDYQTYDKRGDIYCLFVEKGFSLLKSDGYISYIMPNKWFQAGYGKGLRKLMLLKRILLLIDFGDIQVFEGATTYPCIFVSKNSNPKDSFLATTLKNTDLLIFNTTSGNTFEVYQTINFNEDAWVISSCKDQELLLSLQKKYKSLTEFVNGEANYGIKFGLTEAFLIDENTKKNLIEKDSKSSEILGKVLRGRNLTRYGTPEKKHLDNLILASFGSYKFLKAKYPAIYDHLIQYEEKLKSRGQCKGSKITESKPFLGQHHWLELDNNPSQEYLEIYSKPKIMYQAFQVKPCFIFDEQGLFCNNSMWIIPTNNKGLLGILNSKMGWWLITKYCTQIQNGCQLIWKYFGRIPVPNLNKEIEELVKTIIQLNKEFQDKIDFVLSFLQQKYNLEKISTKLSKFYELDFKEFIKQLKLKKLGLEEERELMSMFEKDKSSIVELKQKIDATDREIDEMVFDLYGLSEEEKELVQAV